MAKIRLNITIDPKVLEKAELYVRRNHPGVWEQSQSLGIEIILRTFLMPSSDISVILGQKKSD